MALARAEAGAARKAAPKAKEGGSRTVPHEAMQAERVQRQALERQLAEEKRQNAERNARLEERLAILGEALQPTGTPAKPDPTKDFPGYIRNLESRVQTFEQTETDRRKQADEGAKRQQAEQAVWNRYQESWRHRKGEFPDQDDAGKYLYASRVAELQAMGYDPASVAQQIRNDEFSIAYDAIQRGTDPAEMIYNWAK